MGDTKRQSHAERLAMEITDDIERLIEAFDVGDGKKAGRVKGLLFANLKALAFGSLGEEQTLPEPDPKHVNYSDAVAWTVETRAEQEALELLLRTHAAKGHVRLHKAIWLQGFRIEAGTYTLTRMAQ